MRQQKQKHPFVVILDDEIGGRTVNFAGERGSSNYDDYRDDIIE